MKHRLPLISEGSAKTVIALALVSLAALPLFGLYGHRVSLAAAPKKAHMQSQEVKRRAVAICTTMGTPHPIMSEPQFIAQAFHPQTPHGQRRLWSVDCLVGAHHYNLIFNDLTGNVESMYADGLTISSRAAATTALAINSPSDAVEGSVRRLKDLQMTPKGTKIALAQPPECDRDGVTWRLVWKVLPPASAKPYEVRMALIATDATPLMAVNCNEMAIYARD